MSNALKNKEIQDKTGGGAENAFAQQFAAASAASEVTHLGGLLGSFRDAAKTINDLARALEAHMPDGVPSDVLAILGQIAHQADSIAQGTRPAFETLGGIRETLENQTLGAALDDALISGLEQDKNRDALTGVNNRGYMDVALDKAIAGEGRFSLILLDVDRFKGVNDTYGHVAGDRVLQETIATAAGVIRRKDTVLARFGGEEFALLVAGGATAANRVAERIRAAIAARETFVTPEGTYVPAVTVSLGVAGRHRGDTAESLIKRADAALYEAKSGGRNRVVNAATLKEEKRHAAKPVAVRP